MLDLEKSSRTATRHLTAAVGAAVDEAAESAEGWSALPCRAPRPRGSPRCAGYRCAFACLAQDVEEKMTRRLTIDGELEAGAFCAATVGPLDRRDPRCFAARVAAVAATVSFRREAQRRGLPMDSVRAAIYAAGGARPLSTESPRLSLAAETGADSRCETEADPRVEDGSPPSPRRRISTVAAKAGLHRRGESEADPRGEDDLHRRGETEADPRGEDDLHRRGEDGSPSTPRRRMSTIAAKTDLHRRREDGCPPSRRRRISTPAANTDLHPRGEHGSPPSPRTRISTVAANTDLRRRGGHRRAPLRRDEARPRDQTGCSTRERGGSLSARETRVDFSSNDDGPVAFCLTLFGMRASAHRRPCVDRATWRRETGAGG